MIIKCFIVGKINSIFNTLKNIILYYTNDEFSNKFYEIQ